MPQGVVYIILIHLLQANAYFYLIQEMLIQIFLSFNAYKCKDMHVPSDYDVPSD